MCTYNGCARHDGEVIRVITIVHLSRKCVHECVLTMDVPFMMARYSESLLEYTFQENVCMNVYLQMDVPFMIARYSESLLEYTFQENVCMNVYLQWMCPS